jgi:DNA-binding LytR/AlgR family response regulator
VQSAIIFTTAFDEYAIKAFKLKSIDYLLKPIVQDELKAALKKFKEMTNVGKAGNDLHILYDMIVKKSNPYRERFSVAVGQKIKTFTIGDVAYFKSEGGYTNACLNDGRCYCIDQSLDVLSKETDPMKFFRINRQMLVAITSIREVHVFAKSRLKLDILPKPGEDVFVSIDKVVPFKRWLEGGRD